MIIIAGHLTVDAALRSRYLDAVHAVGIQARAAPGCLDFVQTADPLQGDRIVIFERWESDEDLHRFRSSGGPPLAGVADVLGADVHLYRIASIEPP